MKKLLLSLLAVAVATVAVNAQGLVSKKGEVYLPEAGDYAISIDAVPVLNLFKFNDQSRVVSAQGLSNFTITTKKFNSATEAFRFGVTVNLNQTNTETEVAELNDGVDDMTDDDVVTDRNRTKSTNVQLFLGKEYRTGSTRVQGFVGADLFTGFAANSTELDFGNDEDDLAVGTYVTETKSGLAFTIGARAIAGAEYFVAPKLSIGFQAALAFGYNSQSEGETEVLTVTRDGGNGDSDRTTIDGTVTSNSIGLNTGLTGGQVNLTFHF